MTRENAAEGSTRERLARTLGRRGMFAALITAGGVFATLLVQAFLLSALGATQAAAYLGLVGGDAPSIAGSALGTLVNASLVTALPFAVGVFLSLWQLLPVAPELRFSHVVARSIVAAVAGGVATIAVSVVVAVVAGLASIRILSDGFSSLTSTGNRIWIEVLSGVISALRAFVIDVPLVVLAGLLLWGWLQRFPPRHGVTGALDEI